MGLFVAGGELVVVNQNVAKPFSGEMPAIPAQRGKARRATDQHNPDAPFAPRGVVLLKGILCATMPALAFSHPSGQKAPPVADPGGR